MAKDDDICRENYENSAKIAVDEIYSELLTALSRGYTMKYRHSHYDL